jgi:hypothetical protein
MTQQASSSNRPPFRLSGPASRALAAATYAALAVGTVGAAVAPSLGFSLLKLAGLLAAVVLFLSTYSWQANAADAMLDERERGERDRAYVRAHQIIVATLFGSFLYALAARALGLWLPDQEAAIDLLSVFGIAALAAPGAVLAWLVPRAPDEA